VITVYTFQIVVFGVQKLAKKTKYIAKTRSLNNINKINNCINILFMINSKRKERKRISISILTTYFTIFRKIFTFASHHFNITKYVLYKKSLCSVIPISLIYIFK